MIDRFLEVFRGTPEEIKASETINRLQNLPDRSKKSDRDFQQAKTLTRRQFLRRIKIGVGGTALLAASGTLCRLLTSQDLSKLIQPEKQKTYEETYLDYLNAFESVVGGDTEAQTILNFFKERRKRGYLLGKTIIADESADPVKNFYTVIVDPNINREAFDVMQGFAQFDQNALPTHLLLKRVPIDRLWAGVILAHEALHVYQWLSGFEQSRPDGFILGEQEAYELELRLLDKQTNGRFKEVTRRRAADVEPNKYRGRLKPDDLKEMSGLFNPAKSQAEENARIPDYLIALNYAVAESRAKTPAQAKYLKAEYIRDLFENKIPLLG